MFPEVSAGDLPVLVFIIPKVLDGCKATGDSGILIQVVHNSLPHVQVIRVTSCLQTNKEMNTVDWEICDVDLFSWSRQHENLNMN